MDLGRIAVRALFSYLVALALVRLSGKRVVAQATPFDFTIALVLGDLFDDLIWAEVPASQFVMAAGAIFLPAAAVEAASCRSGRFYDLVNGLPAVILREGKSVREEMRSERLSRPDLEHLLRLDGIGPENWERVRMGVVEHDHHLSVLLEPPAEPVQRRDESDVRSAAK